MSGKFKYNYSAETENEVYKIREKYSPNEKTPLEKLRDLDKSSTKKGKIFSFLAGIAGTLFLGGGMSFCLELTDYFILGIVLGGIGITLIISAYPLYLKITKSERERLAPQVMKLSNEVLNGENYKKE